MVFSHSRVPSFIDLSIHLILHSQIALERKCFVLTSRMISSTCSLKAKSSEVIKTLLSQKKLDGFRHHQEERANRQMN